MPTIPEAFQIAVSHHQAGRLPQAADIYRQILQAYPQHAPAMHLLGVIAHQTAQHEQAIKLISSAIRLEGNQAHYHANLGEAFRATGRLDDAKACYRKAISLDPTLSDPHYNLALALHASGHRQDAIQHCQQAIALRPDHVRAINDLGNMMHELGRTAEAQAYYERALTVDPNYFDALVNLASMARARHDLDGAEGLLRRAFEARPGATDVAMYLGDVECARERWPAAVAWYERGLAIEPSSHRLAGRLAAALQGHGQVDRAIEQYHRAIALKPDVAEVHFNLATAYEAQGRVNDAVAEYQETLRYDPNYPGAHVNLGAYWQDQGEQDQALSHYDRVLAVCPDSAEAHYNRALILLRGAKFVEGWQEYHWRLKLPKFPLEVREESLWDGSPLHGQTLLVHAEQGLGDTLNFIRYIPLLAPRAPSVIVRIHTPLVRLLRESGFQVYGHEDPLPHFDCQVPLISLPGMLGTDLSNIPAKIPYLVAAGDLVEKWRERLAPLPGFRVGICWQGSRENKGDHARSIPLAAFGPLARVAGVQLVSLQKREGVEQLAEVKDRFEVHELGDDWDDAAGPFRDTAAVIKNLDLVITADTSIGHLAGALGAPVWLALGVRSDWRWMLAREDTPWYPAMRLFRQTKLHDWAGVFARMAERLAELAAR